MIITIFVLKNVSQNIVSEKWFGFFEKIDQKNESCAVRKFCIIMGKVIAPQRIHAKKWPPFEVTHWQADTQKPIGYPINHHTGTHHKP